MTSKSVFIHCILPLFIGMLIYCWWRKQIILFDWLYIPSVFLQMLRNTAPISKSLVPNWFVHNLPDGLWLFALTNMIFMIWRNSFLELCLWLICVLILAISTEFLQLNHLLSGTYDSTDILSYFIAWFSSIFIFIKKINL